MSAYYDSVSSNMKSQTAEVLIVMQTVKLNCWIDNLIDLPTSCEIMVLVNQSRLKHGDYDLQFQWRINAIKLPDSCPYQ